MATKEENMWVSNTWFHDMYEVFQPLSEESLVNPSLFEATPTV